MFKLILASMFLLACQMAHAEMTVNEGSIRVQQQHQEASHTSYKAHLEHQQKIMQAYALKPLFWVALDIKRILSGDVLDIGKLDLATYTYVKSKHGNRKNKNDFLWSLVMKYQGNTERSFYLIDTMSELNPIEKTDEITRAFQQANATALKLRYLNLLMDSMGANCAANHPKDALKAKNFLIGLIEASQNEDVVADVMVNFPDYFINEDTYSTMINRLDDLNVHQPKMFERVVTNSNFWYHWLWLANHGDEFDSSWVGKLSQRAKEYAMTHVSFSKKIKLVFESGLEARVEQTPVFLSQYPQQSQEEKDRLLLEGNNPHVSDEMNVMLKILKKTSDQRDHWRNNAPKNDEYL
tara:strand:+ start:13253 stop:14308 length:1056 start_codon:yes stop_codon:yes gene_type:complete